MNQQTQQKEHGEKSERKDRSERSGWSTQAGALFYPHSPSFILLFWHLFHIAYRSCSSLTEMMNDGGVLFFPPCFTVVNSYRFEIWRAYLTFKLWNTDGRVPSQNSLSAPVKKNEGSSTQNLSPHPFLFFTWHQRIIWNTTALQRKRQLKHSYFIQTEK